MTLRQEVAQLVMPRLEGPHLDDPRMFSKVQTLVEEGIGGFILFGGTIEYTPRQLQQLQSFAALPLLIASDIERGLGQQLRGGTRFPGQRAVTAAIKRRSKKDVGLLDKMLDAIRIETRAAGIHAVFSPVVDVNNNPRNPIICTRSFGDDPEAVAWFGSHYIQRFQKESGKGRLELLACAKHFPGHGDTDQDSHSVLPVIHATRTRLNQVELPPFRRMIQDGVGMVMVAHLLVPALEPEKPTTFSKKTITALLREGMEFDGLIVSDALNMGALNGICSPEETAVRALEAGIDILLHPHDALATIGAVVSAVESGRLTRNRIRESVERVLAAKSCLGLFDSPESSDRTIDYQKHGRIAAEIGKKAIEVLSVKKNTLPLRREAGVACFVFDDDNQSNSGDMFIRAMKERFKYLTAMVVTPNSDIPESFIMDCLATAEYVVIGILSQISASKGHSGISDRLHKHISSLLKNAKTAKAKRIVISFDSPYVLKLFRDADAHIAAYDRMDEIQQATAALLARR